MVLTDYEKGLFKYIRKVCIENLVDLVEFWPFLNDSINWNYSGVGGNENDDDDCLSSEAVYQVFQKVENYLRNKRRLEGNSGYTKKRSGGPKNSKNHNHLNETRHNLNSIMIDSDEDFFFDAEYDTYATTSENDTNVTNEESSYKANETVVLDDTIDNLCFNLDQKLNLGSTTTPPEPEKSTFQTPTRETRPTKNSKSRTSRKLSESIINEPNEPKITKLYLETRLEYSKTDKQFYEALIQFIPDEDHMDEILKDYEEVGAWFRHTRRFLSENQNGLDSLRTPRR